jgi:hypothetical protein
MSPHTSPGFKLRGLALEARYRVSNINVPGVTEVTDRALLEEGLLVEAKEQPVALLFVYRRQ